MIEWGEWRYNRWVTALHSGMVIPGLAGRWRVERELGRGSYGATFLARGEDGDSGGRAVALRQLRVDRPDEPFALKICAEQGLRLSALAHPRVPRYRDLFAFDGSEALSVEALAAEPRPASLILVQDYVEGRSLRQAMDAGVHFDAAEIERLLRELLGVLDYLHRRPVPWTHRDIKPENVVLDAQGAPHLVGFGVFQARLVAPDQHGGTMQGTPGYAPLEQIMGHPWPASDLYALAMTMVVAATHVAAPDKLPIRLQTGKVDLHLVSAELPLHLERTLDAMLEPVMGARVPSARAALKLLDGKPGTRDAAPRELPVAYTPASPDPLRWVWRASMGLGVVSACVLYGLFFDALSETELMQIAPVWIAAVAFGYAGSKSRRTRSAGSRLGVGAASAVAALASLSFFFSVVWPSL